MFIGKLRTDSSAKLKKINRFLKESCGVTVSKDTSIEDLVKLRNSTQKSIENMRINENRGPKDSVYVEKFLMLESVNLMISEKKKVINEFKRHFRHKSNVRRSAEGVAHLVISYLKAPHMEFNMNDAYAKALEEYEKNQQQQEKPGLPFKPGTGTDMEESEFRWLVDTNIAKMCPKTAEIYGIVGSRLAEDSFESANELASKLMNQFAIDEIDLNATLAWLASDGSIELSRTNVDLFNKLTDVYANEMPYNIRTGDEGDPESWMADEISEEYSDLIDAYEDGFRAGGGAVMPREEDTMLSFENFENISEEDSMNIKKLRQLIESEVEQAEVIIAAKGFAQEIQEMIEKVGRLQNEDLNPVIDQMRESYGVEMSTIFGDKLHGELQTILDNLKSTKEKIDKSVDKIANGQTPDLDTDMDMDMDVGGDDFSTDEFGDIDGDIDSDIDGDMELDDPFGGDDSVSGPEEEPLGREAKESIKMDMKNKIMEMRAQLKAARNSTAK